MTGWRTGFVSPFLLLLWLHWRFWNASRPFKKLLYSQTYGIIRKMVLCFLMAHFYFRRFLSKQAFMRMSCDECYSPWLLERLGFEFLRSNLNCRLYFALFLFGCLAKNVRTNKFVWILFLIAVKELHLSFLLLRLVKKAFDCNVCRYWPRVRHLKKYSKPIGSSLMWHSLPKWCELRFQWLLSKTKGSCDRFAVKPLY